MEIQPVAHYCLFYDNDQLAAHYPTYFMAYFNHQINTYVDMKYCFELKLLQNLTCVYYQLKSLISLCEHAPSYSKRNCRHLLSQLSW